MSTDPFADVRGKFMHELNAEQYDRATELWLREQIGPSETYWHPMLQRLFRIIDRLRGQIATDKPRTRRVVCAAIRGSNGQLALGIRHYSQDMIDQIEHRQDFRAFIHRLDDDQGFVDQYGVYMTRAEAYVVALTAGQIINSGACTSENGVPQLFSEGLY